MIFKAKRYTSNNKLLLSYSGVLLICSMSLLLLINFTERFVHKKNVSSSKKLDSESTISKDCYQRTNNDYEIDYLDDVLDRTPTAESKMPSISPSCKLFEEFAQSLLMFLICRQACAIESAARLNPERNVYVLFASPVGFRSRSVSDVPKNIEVLRRYPNIHWRNNDLWKYAKDTPLETWLSDGTLFESAYFREQISDILRYLTLHKFGGICLNVVDSRDLDDLGQNFARGDSDDAIGCGELQFGTNKSMDEECLRFLLNKFAVQVFVDTGTLDYTRTLEGLCNTKNGTRITREQCEGSLSCFS